MMMQKDETLIPSGFYCYDILEIVKQPEGMPIIRTKVCPYWERLGPRDDQLAYCHFLEEKDDFFLWDQVKICSVRADFEDEFGEDYSDDDVPTLLSKEEWLKTAPVEASTDADYQVYCVGFFCSKPKG